MLLYFIRFLFLVTITALLLISLNTSATEESDIVVFIVGMAVAILVIAVECSGRSLLWTARRGTDQLGHVIRR